MFDNLNFTYNIFLYFVNVLHFIIYLYIFTEKRLVYIVTTYPIHNTTASCHKRWIFINRMCFVLGNDNGNDK